MKRYKIQVIFVLILIISISACKKNIEDGLIHQNGGFTEAQLLQNPDYVKGFLASIYNYLQVRFDLDGNGAMLASASDEAVNSNLNSAIFTMLDGTWAPTRTFDDSYSNYYSGLRKTNLFLKTICKGEIRALASITSDSLRTRWKGEAYFLRAYFHFELVKRYGAIVLSTRVFERSEDLNLPKNTFDECVNQIVSDCDSAIARLPQWNSDYNLSTDTKEIGRATQISAMALKARMLLYAASPLYNTSNDLSKWQKAADAAKAIIDLNKAQILTSYANVFNYSTAAYNNEVLFATQANNINTIEMNNAPISYDGALGRTNPTQELVDAFEMKTTGLPILDSNSGYDPANPYNNRDPRLALTIFYNGSTFKTLAVQTYVGGKDGIGQNVNATKTGYYMKKFLSENARWNQTSNASVRRPWVIFRYAEVVLNYAEALNEAQGPVADVYAKVNLVRLRTGVVMPALQNTNAAGAGYVLATKDAMRKRIHNERRVELCFEDHRFYDVRRWKEGTIYFNVPVTGMRITVNASGVPIAYDRFQVQNRSFEDKQYFYPFPQSQKDLQPNLVQNLGW